MVTHLSLQTLKGIFQSQLSSQLLYFYIKGLLVLHIAVTDENGPDAYQPSRSSEHFSPINISVIALLLHKELIYPFHS